LNFSFSLFLYLENEEDDNQKVNDYQNNNKFEEEHFEKDIKIIKDSSSVVEKNKSNHEMEMKIDESNNHKMSESIHKISEINQKIKNSEENIEEQPGYIGN